MATKTPHLKDLFQTGQELKLEIPNPSDFENPVVIDLWLRKPSVTQYEEGLANARGKQGRRRARYRDTDSDEYLALSEQVQDLDKEALVDELLSFEQNRLRSEAYNTVLYGDADEEEPRWGKEGSDYLDVLAGLGDRYEEIAKHNDSLSEEDEASLKIKPEEDEELIRLNGYIDEFGKARDELVEKLVAQERAKHMRSTADTLRKELMKKMIDLDCNLVHYQEFKTMMVYFSVRYADDHHRRYFASVDDIWELPDYVRVQLFDAYDRLEQAADTLKNWPSPQSS